MQNLPLFLFINISIMTLPSIAYCYFIVQFFFLKRKETSHWIFIVISFFLLLRMTSIYLLVIPALKENSAFGTLLYRLQSISTILLPALFTHFFYSLLNKKSKNILIIILLLYFFSLLFYIAALLGLSPITKEFAIDNYVIRNIINRSSYFYKLIIIMFIFSFIFSIAILNKLSKTEMINKNKKTITILKWAYIFTFGYGYIIQYIISFLNPNFFSISQYLIIFFSFVLFYAIKRYNFLKPYQTEAFSDLIDNDFTHQFIITDEKGVIIKSNINHKDNDSYYGKSIYQIFPDSKTTIESILENGGNVKNLDLMLFDQLSVNYTVDINAIKDKFQDIIGLFIILSDYKISFDSFSNREQEIIVQLRDGLSYKEIAYKLNISYNTVNSHIKNIYKKSYVNDRKELLDLLNHIE